METEECILIKEGRKRVNTSEVMVSKLPTTILYNRERGTEEVVVWAWKPATWGAEAGGSPSSRSSCTTE